MPEQEEQKLTIEDIKEMSQDQINERWPAVSEALSADRHRDPEDAR